MEEVLDSHFREEETEAQRGYKWPVATVAELGLGL